MKKELVVMDGDKTTGNELRTMLAGQPYNVILVATLQDCEAHLQQHACNFLLIDLDTVAIDNRNIGRLKKKYPGLSIIAKSARKYHPELEDALRNFIYACLAKPLDPDELIFWLKSLPQVNGEP